MATMTTTAQPKGGKEIRIMDIIIIIDEDCETLDSWGQEVCLSNDCLVVQIGRVCQRLDGQERKQ